MGYSKERLPIMINSVLDVRGLTKKYGGITATDDIFFNISGNEISAIIGPNGAGKTTLIGQLTGEIKPDKGSIYFKGEEITNLASHKRSHIGISRSFQITSIFLDLTVLENAALSVQAHTGHSFHFLKPAKKEFSIVNSAINLLERVGLKNRAHLPAKNISHGEHRQLEIAMALASNPTLLLLDEPMAGMGPKETRKITQLLKSIKGTMSIILIEHDMDTVFALADKLTVLVTGKVIASGIPEIVRELPEVRRAYLGEKAN